MIGGQSPLQVNFIPVALENTLSKMIGTVYNLNNFDVVTTQLNIPPTLLNFYLASPLNLSQANNPSLAQLGTVVFIPVQLSADPRGRTSLFYLNVGNPPLLTGIIVTNQVGMALVYMERKSGGNQPAQTNDMYHLSLKSRDNQLYGGVDLTFDNTNLQTGEAVFQQSNGLTLFKCSFFSLLHTNW